MTARLSFSFLLLVMCWRTWAQDSSIPPAQRLSELNSNAFAQISADIVEDSFWNGISLASHEARVITFWGTNSATESQSSFDGLAILPDLNSIYEFRVCGRNLLLITKEAGWDIPGARSQIDPQDYLTSQLRRFSSLISHAARTDGKLSIPDYPRSLGSNDEFKARRIEQVRDAAAQLFKQRPLRLVIGDFSPFSDVIYAILPGSKSYVIFNVIRACGAEDDVEVGREYPLSTIRKDLRGKITNHSTTITIY